MISTKERYRQQKAKERDELLKASGFYNTVAPTLGGMYSDYKEAATAIEMERYDEALTWPKSPNDWTPWMKERYDWYTDRAELLWEIYTQLRNSYDAAEQMFIKAYKARKSSPVPLPRESLVYPEELSLLVLREIHRHLGFPE